MKTKLFAITAAFGLAIPVLADDKPDQQSQTSTNQSAYQNRATATSGTEPALQEDHERSDQQSARSQSGPRTSDQEPSGLDENDTQVSREAAGAENKAETEVDVNGKKTSDSTETSQDGQVTEEPSGANRHKGVQMRDIPNIAELAIRERVGTGRIQSIEETKMDGVTVYKVDYEQDGESRKLHITEGGRVIEF